jgi:hypothetical protein
MITFNLSGDVLSMSGETLDADFSSKKLADANVSGEAVTLAGSMVSIDKATGGFTPMIGTGKDAIAASGVSRIAPALDVPTVKEQGMAVQDGTTGYFVFADAAVNVYGYNEKNGIWLQIGSPAAKEGFNVPMNSDYTHAEHGTINISRVFVRDAAATAAARSQARMIPQKSISGASASSAAGKSLFTKDVEIDQDLQVDGALSAGSAILSNGLTVTAGDVSLGPIGYDGISANIQSTTDNVSLGPIGLDGICKFVATQDSVQLGPIGHDGIALNIADSAASFGKTGSVNLKADANFVFAGKPGTTENGLYVHKDHGVCLVSSGGNVFGLRVDDAGNLSVSSVGTAVSLEVPMC